MVHESGKAEDTDNIYRDRQQIRCFGGFFACMIGAILNREVPLSATDSYFQPDLSLFRTPIIDQSSIFHHYLYDSLANIDSMIAFRQ